MVTTQSHFEAEQLRIKRAINCMNYLESMLSITISNKDVLAKKLAKNSHQTLPSYKHMKLIIRDWNFWSPYLDKKDISNFVISELTDLFRIGCTATVAVDSETTRATGLYVGTKAHVIKKMPITMSSGLSIYGRFETQL